MSAVAEMPGVPKRPVDWLRLWFLLRDPVRRREYGITGFVLMAFKYVVEFVVVGQLTGLVYTPLAKNLPVARRNGSAGCE
jgi:hypothetical protein